MKIWQSLSYGEFFSSLWKLVPATYYFLCIVLRYDSFSSWKSWLKWPNVIPVQYLAMIGNQAVKEPSVDVQQQKNTYFLVSFSLLECKSIISWLNPFSIEYSTTLTQQKWNSAVLLYPPVVLLSNGSPNIRDKSLAC